MGLFSPPSPYAQGSMALGKRALLARDLVIAVWELALARIAFASLDLHALAKETAPASLPDPATAQATSVHGVVARVSYLLPRVAHRLPWRTDCMVQAIAGQAWLRRYGIETRIAIGIDREGASDFEAHAWLEHRGKVIAGGETGRFTVIFTQDRGSN